FQAEDGIRDFHVTGVQTCALPISLARERRRDAVRWAGPGRPGPAVAQWTAYSTKYTSSSAACSPADKASCCRTTPTSSAYHRMKIGRASCRGRAEMRAGAASVQQE